MSMNSAVTHRLTDYEVNQKYQHLFRHGRDTGIRGGFTQLPLNYKKGSTTYIYAPPSVGKSYFWLNQALFLAQKHGWRHVIYSPEMGEPQDLLATMTEILVGNRFYDDERFGMLKHHKDYAEKILMKNFVIIDQIESLEHYWEEVERLKQEGQIDCMTIDPWSHMPGDQDWKELNRQLVFNMAQAKKLNVHSCILTHSAKQDKVQDKKTGVWYYPPMDARDIALGQAWFRNGMNMVGLWKPSEGLIDGNTGTFYEENHFEVHIHKAKPVGCAEVGEYRIYMDKRRRTYYEIDPDTGKRSYPLTQYGYV